jgi:hypothetical protein
MAAGRCWWSRPGSSSSLPNPPPPAFVRPVDIVTGPAIDPQTGGNAFDGFAYYPA